MHLLSHTDWLRYLIIHLVLSVHWFGFCNKETLAQVHDYLHVWPLWTLWVTKIESIFPRKSIMTWVNDWGRTQTTLYTHCHHSSAAPPIREEIEFLINQWEARIYGRWPIKGLETFLTSICHVLASHDWQVSQHFLEKNIIMILAPQNPPENRAENDWIVGPLRKGNCKQKYLDLDEYVKLNIEFD